MIYDDACFVLYNFIIIDVLGIEEQIMHSSSFVQLKFWFNSGVSFHVYQFPSFMIIYLSCEISNSELFYHQYLKDKQSHK